MRSDCDVLCASVCGCVVLLCVVRVCLNVLVYVLCKLVCGFVWYGCVVCACVCVLSFKKCACVRCL